jgi:anthranilate phosphoribosyltransferase
MTAEPSFPELLTGIVNRSNLSREEACMAMRRIMTGEFSSSQIAALAVALRVKGESEDEIAGFVEAMRDGAVKVPDPPADVIDTCGTGGDRLHTFNISTAAALVSAGAGVIVAKHGNRAASSKSGSADVLEALGVKLELPPERETQALREVGIAFLYARTHHPALKHAAEARKELGIRTLFNLLGPMTNPAGARRQLMGVFPGIETEKVAGVLNKLGVTRAMVVRGDDGMDEITLTGTTRVSEVQDGSIRSYEITPGDFGMQPATLKDLAGGDAQENATIIRKILDGKTGPCTDIVALNAGAVIYLAGKTETHAVGIEKARTAISSGAAAQKLEQLIEFTNR